MRFPGRQERFTMPNLARFMIFTFAKAANKSIDKSVNKMSNLVLLPIELFLFYIEGWTKIKLPVHSHFSKIALYGAVFRI